MDNILNIKNRYEFRSWLMANSLKEKECYVLLKRGKPIDEHLFYYVDAIEEALCFGWIDSKVTDINGVKYQRFTPRQKKSNWTELNLARVSRLEKLGLMTDEGRKALPSSYQFIPDQDIISKLKEAGVYDNFLKFPILYQKIRLSNLMFYKKLSKQTYLTMLKHTIEATKVNKTFGEWNDYGRL